MARFGTLGLLCLAVATAAPVEFETSCQECEFSVRILHNMWGGDTLTTCVGDLIAYICEDLQIEDNFVCQNIGNEFAAEATWVVGQIIVEPEELCGLLIKGCGDFVDPRTQNWTLPIAAGKPAHPDPAPIQTDKPVLKMLHLSDLHIDMYYTVGMEAQCIEPQCCRPLSDPDEATKPVGSQADVVVPAGKWGTTHAECDSPYWLFTNMVEYIAANHKDLDYVVVSGDLESHADWDYTQASHAAMVKNVSDTIRAALDNVPVFFAVGNHEGVPIDNFAPHYTPEEYHMDWLYDTMADAWQGWVPDDQMDTVRYNACYMRKLFPGLRIISLHNGLGDANNFWLYVNQTDPDGTLAWLQTQLLDAESAGDKVHIVAHIPGEASELLEGYSINYYNLLNRQERIGLHTGNEFEDTITAQLFGHTHSEEYNMFYLDPNDASSRPTGVSYSAPSLTPYSQYFPAYRVYQVEGNYEGSNYRIIDWAEYYLNLTEANASDNPQWKVLYASVLEEYGLKDVSPSEWSNMITRMVTDTALFNKYRFNYYRQDSTDPCDWSCQQHFLCSARKSHHNDDLCSDLPPASTPVKRKANYAKKASAKPKSSRGRISEDEVKRRAREFLAKRNPKLDSQCTI